MKQIIVTFYEEMFPPLLENNDRLDFEVMLMLFPSSQ